MGSFKQLKTSDVITVPIIANKQWDFYSCAFISNKNTGVNFYNGVNLTGSFNPGHEDITNGQYDRLVYKQIDQLYYHCYSGSLNTSSLSTSLYYESASEQRPTASYFNFNNDSGFVSNFPTGSNDSIKVISISPQIFGNRILPGTLRMDFSYPVGTYITDDSKGNVIYTPQVGPSANYLIGNIFYSEGIIVITNQEIQSIFQLPPVVYDYNINICMGNYPEFSFNPLSGINLRGGVNNNTIINHRIQLLENDDQFFSTGSGNIVILTFEQPGTYQTKFICQTMGSSCDFMFSNTGSITINVT
jgi:hypothetical protein